MNELKNQGVKDVLIICVDGLTRIKETIGTSFPETEYQRHRDVLFIKVRNVLKYVHDKDRKAFATELKTILIKRKLWKHLNASLRNGHQSIQNRLNAEMITEMQFHQSLSFRQQSER